MKNLRWYNKEGYPYNFNYNESTLKWEGKLLFDQNSSDLYKTLGVYVFEHVEPTEITDYFDFDKFELFNNSGMTFKGETKQNIPISGISKTNSSAYFYTKWVHGKGFHQLFPAGCVVKFNNIVGSNIATDFNTNEYFSVLAVKKDAFMVETVTNNNAFNSIVFTSGLVSTYNIIKYPDYNRNLYSYFTDNLYVDKKLTVIDSTKNDGVKSLKEYYIGNISNRLSRPIYDYSLNGSTGDYINLELSLYTDRPILYDGSFTINGNIIKFDTPFKDVINVGQNIIFEDYNGNKLLNGNTYTVTSVISEVLVDTKEVEFYEIDDITITPDTEYFVKFSGDTTLKINDIIYFSGTTDSLNDNMDYKILNVLSSGGYTTLQLEQHVHTESGITLGIYNRLKYYEYDTIVTTGTPYYQSLTGVSYLTTNKLNFRQEIIAQVNGYMPYEETIKAFVYNYSSDFNANGINAYYLDGRLVLEGLYEYKYKEYFTPVLTVQNLNGSIISTIVGDFLYSTGGKTGVHYIVTNDRLYNESVSMNDSDKLAINYYEEILLTLNPDSIDYGFTMSINSVDYYIAYNNFSGTTTCTQQTINDFVIKYGSVLYNNGIYIHSGVTADHKIYVETLYPNVKILDLRIKVNAFSTYDIIFNNTNSAMQSPIVITGNQLVCKGGTDLFNAGLSTGMVVSITGGTHNENQKEYNIIGLTWNTIQLSYQGAFFEDTNVIVTLNSREYIRKPRESYNKDIYYRVSWVDIPDMPYDDSIFLYDISGDQLKPPVDSSGNYIISLAYVGQKPLFNASQQNTIRLNKEPNKKLENVSNPKYQQTIFSQLEFALPQKDSNDEFNYLPKPLEIFIGYSTSDEGVNSNVLKVEKVEYLILSGTTGINDNYFVISNDGLVEFKSNGFVGFDNYGFEVGQYISMRFEDASPLNQKTFDNYDTYKILSVSKNKITLDIGSNASNFVSFTSNMDSRIFNYIVQVVPIEIARFTIMGETEIEDERFDVNLKNLGININKEEEVIFRQSDINEYGVDYTLLNQKRKEMLIMYPDIYNYVGSYKSLIAAINYFGYSDLEVYEYYKNINSNSPLYKKYFRVRIPDMFDMQVDGWNEYDFIKAQGNRNNYQKTSSFNLTYNITDEDGNNLNLYSLKEVQIKLQKLKVWLRENILPLSSNITDITGAAKMPTTIYAVHDVSNSVRKIQSTSSSVVVNFNYTATLSFNTNYLMSINFYTTSGYIPSNFELIVKTFSKDADGKLIPVQYFKLYKTNFDTFNFSVDKLVDPFIYVEVSSYNDYGVGIKNNKIFNFDEAKNYYLINNNFKYKYYSRLKTSDGYYIIDDDGQLWIVK